MVKPSPDHIRWAKYLQLIIPEVPSRVVKYLDEGDEHQIHIFSADQENGTTCATIGLMDIDQSLNGSGLHTEIILDCRNNYDFVGNVLSTVAFFCIKDRWRIKPGVVFETLIDMYTNELEVKHLMFTSAFQWTPEVINSVKLDAKTIYPLLAVPITESENRFIQLHGDEALEDLWEQHQVDVLNWKRKSAT